MNQNKRTNRRIILSSIMLIIICSVFSSQSSDSRGNVIYYEEPSEDPTSSAFTGTGMNFQATQYATAISSTYDVNPITTTSFTLTNGWIAENITINAENVTRYRNLIQNPTCDSDVGQSYYPDWQYVATNGVQFPLDVQINRLSLDVGYGTITPDEIAYFNQTVSIDEEEVPMEMVELSFDARMYNSPGPSGLYLFGAIIIGGVEHNYTIDTTTDTLDTYSTYTMQYYLSDEGQEFPNDVEFRFGVYVNQTLVYGSDPDHNDVHFDNIEFNVYTYVNQSHALIAQDQDDFTDYYYTNTSSGDGEFSIDIQKSYGSTQDVEFQIRQNSTLDGLVEIDNLTITSDLIRTINTSSSSYQDGAFGISDDILWTFDVSPSIPASYTNKRVEIEKPVDWVIVSAVDSFLTNQTSSCTDLGYGTTKFTIPTTVFSSGDWQIRARSKSWFDEAKLEFWNGASFIEKPDFYIGEDFHVKVNINNTVDFSNTDLNFTIYHPNGTIFYESSEEPSVYEYYFGNFTIGMDNMSVGIYTAEVTWTNNRTSSQVDKVGYKTFEFGVFHSTQLSAVDTLIETVPGEPLLILVTYEDTDTGNGIDLATVQYNSTYGDEGYLTYLGSGYYFLELNTTLYDYTDYFLSFNASKTFYENQTESNFIQLSIEREGMFLEVPRQVNTVSANSYALFEFNLTGEISGAYLSTANMSSDWFGDYEITNPYVNGTYILNVSTYGVISGSFPETFVITITTNKTNYSETSDVVLLQVYPIETDILASEDFVQVSQGDTFNITVDYTDSAGGTRVANSLCNVTWERTHTTSNTSNGFEIEFSTTGLDLDQYTIAILCNSSGYETQTEYITVLVEPIYTIIDLDENFVQISQGDTFNISVDYTDDAGGTRVPNSDCEITWGRTHTTSNTSNGFEIEFSTTGLALGQYLITIKCSSSGFEPQTAFVNVLVEPVQTTMSVNEPIVTVTQGDTFNITADYTDDAGGTRVPNSDCEITWGRTHTTSNTSNGFEIEFSTTGLNLGQYIATILCYSPGYQTQSYFVTVLVEPITTTLTVSNLTVTTYSGHPFNITVDYEEELSSNPVVGASCFITWDGTTSSTSTATGFEITFYTDGMNEGQYSATILVNGSGYESQTVFIIVQINKLPSNLELISETHPAFFKGDQGHISVNFTVDGTVFPTGSVYMLEGIEGTLQWTGSSFDLTIDTSDLDPKTYFCRIYGQADGVQTSQLELLIDILPVELDVSISPEIYLEYDKDGSNIIYITVNDTSHGNLVDDVEILCTIGETTLTAVSIGEGTYSLDLALFELTPITNPYLLEISVINPNGDDYDNRISIGYTRNLNLVFWIAGAVAGTAILGISSLFVYNRYIKQTRFQRDVAYIKKNIANVVKIKSRTEPTRDKIVSDIINKEIDQLL